MPVSRLRPVAELIGRVVRHLRYPFLVGVPFTLFIVVYITNAINLIDGIDGLASGLSCISMCVLGGICLWFGHYIHCMVAFAWWAS